MSPLPVRRVHRRHYLRSCLFSFLCPSSYKDSPRASSSSFRCHQASLPPGPSPLIISLKTEDKPKSGSRLSCHLLIVAILALPFPYYPCHIMFLNHTIISPNLIPCFNHRSCRFWVSSSSSAMSALLTTGPSPTSPSSPRPSNKVPKFLWC